MKTENEPDRYVTGPYVQMLLEQCVECNVSTAALLTQAGLTQCQLDPLPEQLLTSDYIQLLNAGAILTNDPVFGLHAGQKTRPSSFPILGYTLMSCQTLGQSLEQVLHFESLVHDLGYSEFTQQDGVAYYSWFPYDETLPGHEHLADCVFSGIQVIAQWLAETEVIPLRLELRRDGAGCEEEYQRMARCPVTFGQTNNCFVFSAELLALPVKQADPTLFPTLKQHAEQRLREKQSKLKSGQELEQEFGIDSVNDSTKGSVISFSDTVRELFREILPQQRAQLTLVAEALGITSRSLQRKLKEEGVSFQQLLDDYRQTSAQRLLVETNLPMTEISHQLGYREQSSFNHAFRSKNGLSPTQYRQQARNK